MEFSEIHENLAETVSDKVGKDKDGIPACAVCQSPAEKFCSACNKVAYCSVDHQKAHWKVHKPDCPPMRIVTTPEGGSHYVATRDLPAGTLLFKEKPIITAPSIEGVRACISCSQPFDIKNGFACSLCGWPFCSSACSKSSAHTTTECYVISKCPTKIQYSELISVANLATLRAIHLKLENHTLWAQIMSLDGGDRWPTVESLEPADKKFMKHIIPLLKLKGCQDEILKFRGILDLNALKDKLVGSNPPKYRTIYSLYLGLGILSKSYHPNACKMVNVNDTLVARTAIPVKKDQILSIIYRTDLLAIGAIKMEPRAHIEPSGDFICYCPTCVDPSFEERRILLSGIKCTMTNCKGYLLPMNDRDNSPKALWHCNEVGCPSKSKTHKEIAKYIRGVGIQAKNAGKKNVKELKIISEDLRAKLSPYHCYLLQTLKEWVDEYETRIQDGEKIDSKTMEFHISSIEEMLAMEEIIGPGLTPKNCELFMLILNALHQYLGVEGGTVQMEVHKKKLLNAVNRLLPFANVFPEQISPDMVEKLKILRTRLTLPNSTFSKLNI